MAATASQGVYPASYAAFFAPRTHKFDTVDFRVPASPSNLESYFASSTRERVARARLAGLLGVAIGLVFAVIGFAVDQLTRGLTTGLYTAAARLLRPGSFWPAAVVFVLICLVFVVVAACMVVYIAPLGAGSGIPELKSYLNGVKIPGFLGINSLLVKTVGITFSLSSGLICGKQGPMIHAGAITGAGMSQAASSRFRWRLNSPHFRFLRTEAWKRDFAAVGAAVGVAVAFGSPMGAWMWVYEEACTHWTWDLGIITLGGCLSGAVLVRILNYLAAGIPGAGFGAFTLTDFGKLVTPFGDAVFPLKDAPAFLLLGVVGGVFGAVLPLFNKIVTLFRYKRVTRPVPRIMETVLIAALTAVLRVIIPYLANDCRDVVPELENVLKNAPLGDYSQFNCPDSQFSPWAAVIYNPTDTVVRGLLFASKSMFPAGALAVAFVYYGLFIIWTYGIAVPAGVFFPSFLLGSVYGRLVGIAVQAIFPSRTDVSLTAYAFVGCISALSGVTRTISVAVIALEATGGNDASFAAVVAAIIAKLVGDFLYSRGIYDLHIDLKGVPFLNSKVPKLENYKQVRVSDVMASSVVGVRRLSRLGGLVHILGTNDHHAFPVFVKKTGNGDRSKSSSGQEIQASSSGSPVDEDSLSQSETSVLEAELEHKDGDDAMKPQTSRIITPTHFGMQATIFDADMARVVHLTERGEVRMVATGTPKSNRVRHISAEISMDKEGRGKSDSPDGTREIPDFELMGTIDRGTLLAVMKLECDKEVSLRSSDATIPADEEVPRDEMDAAWPNADRLKGDGEGGVLQRVAELGLGERVVDLRRYIDPDPLLMSDRAYAMTAYKLFRGTGARHILVTSMRSGRTCGIVTRKDILPESVDDALRNLKGIKVE